MVKALSSEPMTRNLTSLIRAAIVAALVVACGPSVAPSSSVGSPLSGAPAVEGSGGLAPSSAGAIPPLLGSTEIGASLAEIDPTTGGRRPLPFPPGHWTIAVGASSVVLSSIESEKPTRLVVADFDGTALRATTDVTLPVGGGWLGAYAACISPSGRIVAMDIGLSLFVIDRGKEPVALPDQQSNLGHCTWVDETHVLWDEEGGGHMAIWDSTSGKTTQVDLLGRSPNAGGPRLAWIDPNRSLVVSAVTTGPDSLSVGQKIASIPHATGSLSADGRWLLVSARPGSADVYDLESATFVPVATVALGPKEDVYWLPVRGG
jgi:hypothetical protein